MAESQNVVADVGHTTSSESVPHHMAAGSDVVENVELSLATSNSGNRNIVLDHCSSDDADNVLLPTNLDPEEDLDAMIMDLPSYPMDTSSEDTIMPHSSSDFPSSVTAKSTDTIFPENPFEEQPLKAPRRFQRAFSSTKVTSDPSSFGLMAHSASVFSSSDTAGVTDTSVAENLVVEQPSKAPRRFQRPFSSTNATSYVSPYALKPSSVNPTLSSSPPTSALGQQPSSVNPTMSSSPPTSAFGPKPSSANPILSSSPPRSTGDEYFHLPTINNSAYAPITITNPFSSDQTEITISSESWATVPKACFRSRYEFDPPLVQTSPDASGSIANTSGTANLGTHQTASAGKEDTKEDA